MRKIIFNNIISIIDTVLFYLGGFYFFLTTGHILLLFNVDFLGLLKDCSFNLEVGAKYVSYEKFLICEIYTSGYKKLVLSFIMLVIWALFILAYKWNNKYYKNVGNEK
ncbi:MAG: hypothetical protein LC109_03175 [Bacteroidia bacterium]|nr:hypothetical protein [Bacteroidia bacterium]